MIVYLTSQQIIESINLKLLLEKVEVELNKISYISLGRDPKTGFYLFKVQEKT
jgi:hypothetical protein